MSEPWTPGPWSVMENGEVWADGHPKETEHIVCFGHDYNEGGSIGGRWLRLSNGRTSISDKSLTAKRAEGEANARLIALAPEMAEFISDAIGWWADQSEMAARARDLLARARGETA